MVSNRTGHYSYSLYKEKKFADAYELNRFGGRFGEYLKNLECRTFNRLLSDCHLVLDVGTGTGKLANYLAEKRRVIATDASLQMLRNARDTARSRGVSVLFVTCDAHHLCFKNASFDAVVCSRVLMHLVKWRCALQELCRVSDRTVIVDFPSVYSFTIFEKKFRSMQKSRRPAIQNYQTFSVKTVAAEFRENCYHVKSKEKMFFFPVALYRKLNSNVIASAAEKIFSFFGLTRIWGSPVLMKVEKNILEGQ